MRLDKYFIDASLLNINQWEKRESQIELAEKIFSKLKAQEYLMAEAPTGIGKSLGYLIPCLLFLKENPDKKIIISTFTHTLQQQLKTYDIKTGMQITDYKVKYEICYGSENYICHRNLEYVKKRGFVKTKEEFEDYDFIMKWINRTDTGLKFDISDRLKTNFFRSVCRTSDTCVFTKCRYFKNNCFYFRARRRWNKSNLLIVNHSLLLTNMGLEKKIFNDDGIFIIDEAHCLYNAALNHFKVTINNFTVKNQLRKIFDKKKNTGILSKHKENFSARFLDLTDEIKTENRRFFRKVEKELGWKFIKRYKGEIDIDNRLVDLLKEYSEEIEKLKEYILIDEEKAEADFLHIKVKEIAEEIEEIISGRKEEVVYWIEKKLFGKKKLISINQLNYNIEEELKKNLYSKINTLILLSATLTVNKQFKFFKENLGLEEIECIKMKDEFDYKKNVKLYLFPRIIAPSNNEEYIKETSLIIKKLIKRLKNKSFFLFTSYEAMNNIYEKIKDEIETKILIQGKQPREKILSEFKQNAEGHLLFGTTSFWQGVDIPGDDLSNVIIHKLPFASPDDPLIQAIIEKYKRKGKIPFFEYQLPFAAIMLKQGFGRLIRRKTDTGNIFILDPRILTKNYGKIFLNSLPECRTVISNKCI